jgi:hypothetical protein
MRIVVELDNIDSVKHAAIVNSGVAILPKLTVQTELAAGSLKTIECEGLYLTRPLGIIQRRDVSMTRAARAFMEMTMRHRVWEGDTTKSSSRDDGVGLDLSSYSASADISVPGSERESPSPAVAT